MAVIIDDLEVVVDQPDTAQVPMGPEGPGNGATKGCEPLAPIDIDNIIRHQMERAWRVRAH